MRHRSLAASVLALFAPLALLYAPPAGAVTAPPPLDPTWGSGGIAAPFLPGRVEAVNDFAIHPDGGAVAVLRSSGLAAEDFVTLKFAADGTLDTSFGDDGMLTTGIESGSIDRATAVAVQPDGRIIVAGATKASSGGSIRFGVVRYLADGRLDSSFSGDGKTITSFGSAYGLPSAVVLRPDGRIVVAGGSGSLSAASYRADGVLDWTFDGDGRVSIPIPGEEPRINDAMLDGEGNLVATGSIDQADSGWDMLTMRIRPDGALDPTFGVGGMAVDDFGFGEDAARAIAIQPDGRILIAGYAEQEDDLEAALSRYAPDGTLDPSFGSGGRVVLDVEELPGSDLAEGVAVLPDGRIVLAGHANLSQVASDAFVAVLTADGALDPTFDAGDGAHTTELGPTPGHDSVGALALSSDAKPMIAGTYAPTTGPGQAIAVARYNTSTPFADVSVTLTATPNPATAGPVELLATVRNDGPVTATDVRFTIEGSRPITSMRATQGRCVRAGKAAPAGCQLGALAPGAEVLVSLGTTVDGSEGVLTALAAVSSSIYDIDYSDNSTTIEVAVNAEPEA